MHAQLLVLSSNRFADQIIRCEIKGDMHVTETHRRIIRRLFCHSNALNSFSAPKKRRRKNYFTFVEKKEK